MDTKDRTRRAASGESGRPQNRRGSSTPRSGGVKTATRTATKNMAAPKKRREASADRTPKKPSPEVVYTQPGPFNRNRFLLHMATVVAVVLALVFGMSIFFKVDEDKITVSGADKYTAWQVREASEIRDGENLLGLSDARISSKIQAALPYVKDVRVGIKLPDTVHIEIIEMEVVYAVEDSEGGWWLMSSDGTIVEYTNGVSAGGHTKLIGVKLDSPVVGQKAVAKEETITETTPDGLTIVTDTHNKEHLDAAVTILQYLENSGIIGQAATVDVSNLLELEFWYLNRFQVKLGDTTQLSYKIRSAKSAIDQSGEYETGVLDASFVLMPDKVILTPFDT